MQNDKTTLKDLSFHTSGEGGIFQLLDYTTTQPGREALRRHIQQPPGNYDDLVNLQAAIRYFADHPHSWTSHISNGTLVMLEKFFESADNATAMPGRLSFLFGTALQKVFNRTESSFVQFSISHLSDFLKGCLDLTRILDEPEVPKTLASLLNEMKSEVEKQRLTGELVQLKASTSYTELATLSYHARRELKNPVYRLMRLYATLDAWRSLALATVKNNWIFPEVRPSLPICLQAKALLHPLLRQPVAYDVDFNQEHNFLLLTGANMSGKTTFMRTLGVSALMAHLGMGVPASSYTISFLEGIITNMHVEDSLILGESYFFAEVQRIKQTAQKLLQPLPHLVLMDELFKGTNVHDAYECTKAVVEGLLRHQKHIMVLSTHLYEVAQEFSERKEIIFSYFVTDLSLEGNYTFSYELRPGISNDRIGYRILQKEGVLDLLKRST